MNIEEVLSDPHKAAVSIDQDGFIQAVTPQFQQLFGWTSDEVIGQPISIIIPPDLRDAHNLGFSRFLTTGEPTVLNRPLKLPAVRKNGSVFQAMHFIVAERRDGRWSFGATIVPDPDGP